MCFVCPQVVLSGDFLVSNLPLHLQLAPDIKILNAAPTAQNPLQSIYFPNNALHDTKYITPIKTAICIGDSSSRYSDSLRAGRAGDRIPVGMKFPAPVRTGPVAHPASCTMGTGSFPGVKRPGRDVDHPPQSRAEVKERVELYLYSSSGPLWTVLGGTLPFYFTYFGIQVPSSGSYCDRGV
jgi:hypothetical protein